MKPSNDFSTRQTVGAMAALALLAGFSALALMLQALAPNSKSASENRSARAPGSSNANPQSAPGVFSVPGMPGAPRSTPGTAASPNGMLPPMPALPGKSLPGQPLLGSLVPGQMSPIAPAPGMQGNPKLAALFAKAADAQRKGDLKSAATSYRELLRASPNALPAHLNLALIFLQQKEPQRAVWHLKRAIQIAPREPQPRAILGQTYMQLKEPREAYKQWTQLAQMKLPDNGQSAFTAGVIAFEQLKEPAAAERWLRQANTQTAGNNPRVAMVLSKILTTRGKHSEASVVLESIGKKFPKMTEIQTSLADAQWQGGDKTKAVATLRALEASTPASANGGLNLSQVRVMLGRALAQQKQYSQATEKLRSALALLPAKSPAIAPTRAILAQTFAAKAGDDEKRGDIKDALASWNEAAQLFPANPLAYLQRGRLFGKQGDDGEALQEFNRALKLAPRDPNALAGAAKASEKTGDPNLAMRHWKTLIENRPDYAPSYFNLARLGAKQKQLTTQMDYLETRLSKNPDNRAAYDSVLEAAQSSGRGELARDWVSQMAKKYPRAKAPRNALIAFERRHPAPKPTPASTPVPKATPKPLPTPKPWPTPRPTPQSTPEAKPTAKPTAKPDDVAATPEDKPEISEATKSADG